MEKYKAAIVRYESGSNSLRNVVELSGSFEHLKPGSRVFIKPNIVFWTNKTDFPKYGVITTSRIIEDTIIYLKEMGIGDITLGEGITTFKPGDREIPEHAYRSMGYELFKKKYGIEVINVFERPFKKFKLDNGISLNINSDILDCDHVINIPVLKTHAQTKVSLGIKNLKGMLDIGSRKICHNHDVVHDLDYMVSRLPDFFPDMITIIDGIYTLEWGPVIDGRARRSNILIASADLLTADMIGAGVLGYEPGDVGHIRLRAQHTGRNMDFSDIEIHGEKLEDVRHHHRYEFPYNDEGTLPAAMAKSGIAGLSYRKYDNTLCTYCSFLTGAVLTAIAKAWKGTPFDNVEILSGKIMEPSAGRNKTILLGQCMYKKHKDNPVINEMIPVKGCPPDPGECVKALQKSGIEVNPDIIMNFEKLGGFYLNRYKDKPEFDDSFYGMVRS